MKNVGGKDRVSIMKKLFMYDYVVFVVRTFNLKKKYVIVILSSFSLHKQFSISVEIGKIENHTLTWYTKYLFV